MWGLAFVLCLLPSSVVVAGESRAQFQVGLTITGNGKASTINPTPAAIAVPLPRARPAALGPGDRAPSGDSGTRR
jgi:hypothetical protein